MKPATLKRLALLTLHAVSAGCFEDEPSSGTQPFDAGGTLLDAGASDASSVLADGAPKPLSDRVACDPTHVCGDGELCD